jgi:hypothetical protein
MAEHAARELIAARHGGRRSKEGSWRRTDWEFVREHVAPVIDVEIEERPRAAPAAESSGRRLTRHLERALHQHLDHRVGVGGDVGSGVVTTDASAPAQGRRVLAPDVDQMMSVSAPVTDYLGAVRSPVTPLDAGTTFRPAPRGRCRGCSGCRGSRPEVELRRDAQEIVGQTRSPSNTRTRMPWRS